jgi:hypothetical protein
MTAYVQPNRSIEHKGKVLKLFSAQILSVHHHLQCIDPDIYGSGNALLRGRSDPSSDASKDQSSGGKGEQAGLAHLILLSVTSAYDATLYALCIVSMPLPIVFGIVCINRAGAINL